MKLDLGSPAGRGLAGLIGGLVGGLLGRPGRATGGPVGPGNAYLVGERGPELFVPTASGRVLPGLTASAGGRPVSVTVNVSVPGGADATFMARTGNQVARSVRAALLRAGD